MPGWEFPGNVDPDPTHSLHQTRWGQQGLPQPQVSPTQPGLNRAAPSGEKLLWPPARKGPRTGQDTQGLVSSHQVGASCDSAGGGRKSGPQAVSCVTAHTGAYPAGHSGDRFQTILKEKLSKGDPSAWLL